MAQITQGLVSVTNGSAIVSGTGTLWLDDVEPTNEFTVAADGVLYTIASVDSNTQITLSAPYAGDTATDVPYAIVRDFTQDGFALLNQGDIETATVFTRSMQRIQTRFNAPSEIAALAAADIYTSVSGGLAGTVDGAYFFVVENGTYTLYSNQSGSEQEEFSFVNASEISEIFSTLLGIDESVTQSYEDFFTTLLGAFDSDPEEDKFGNAITQGAMYFNTDENVLKFFDSGTWLDSSDVAISAAQASKNSATQAAESEINAESFSLSASQSEVNSIAAATDSEQSSQLSEQAKLSSEVAKDKAEQWAEEAVDVVVEDGKFSALHHATKAEESATESSASADSSEVSRQASELAQASAESSESVAIDQAGIATTQANTATDQAGIATTQAGIANDQRVLSEAARSGAEDAQTESTSQANISTDQAGIATTQANISTDSANTATDQAGIATTQAGIANDQRVLAQSARSGAEDAEAQAKIHRDEAEQFAATAAGGVQYAGIWQASDGNPPSPQVDGVDVNGFYRISGEGTLHGVDVVSGDELMYDLSETSWFRIGRDRDSYSKDESDLQYSMLEDYADAVAADSEAVAIATSNDYTDQQAAAAQTAAEETASNADNLSSGTVAEARLPAAALVGDTTYTGGEGIDLTGTTFSVDSSVLRESHKTSADHDGRYYTKAEVEAIASSAIPSGIINMWSGSVAAIPSGFVLCDGTNGTPDLRDRFIVGAGGDYPVGATGGAATTQHSHGHNISAGNTSLTTAQMPQHAHRSGVTVWDGANTVMDAYAFFGVSPITRGTGHRASGTSGTSDNYEFAMTETIGGGQSHSHSISGNINQQELNNRPPYYALAYIMKT